MDTHNFLKCLDGTFFDRVFNLAQEKLVDHGNPLKPGEKVCYKLNELEKRLECYFWMLENEKDEIIRSLEEVDQNSKDVIEDLRTQFLNVNFEQEPLNEFLNYSLNLHLNSSDCFLVRQGFVLASVTQTDFDSFDEVLNGKLDRMEMLYKEKMGLINAEVPKSDSDDNLADRYFIQN